jgi:hypothetical protein
VAYVIHRNITPTGNVGGGLDTLHSFSLPAGSLATNGDFVEFIYGGVLAVNDNNKQLTITFDGDTIEDTGPPIDIDRGWFRVHGTYTRLTDTSVLATLSTMFGFLDQMDGAGTQAGHSVFHIDRSFSTTVADLDTNAVTLAVQAQGTANDDIVQNLSIIKLTQQ